MGKPNTADIPKTGINLDDDEADIPPASAIAGLKTRKPTQPLAPEAKQALAAAAENSVYVNTMIRGADAGDQAAGEPVAPTETTNSTATADERVQRGHYSLPPDDYAKMEHLARFALRQERDIGFAGIIRLGIRVLADMSEDELAVLIKALPPVATAKKKR